MEEKKVKEGIKDKYLYLIIIILVLIICVFVYLIINKKTNVNQNTDNNLQTIIDKYEVATYYDEKQIVEDDLKPTFTCETSIKTTGDSDYMISIKDGKIHVEGTDGLYNLTDESFDEQIICVHRSVVETNSSFYAITASGKVYFVDLPEKDDGKVSYTSENNSGKAVSFSEIDLCECDCWVKIMFKTADGEIYFIGDKLISLNDYYNASTPIHFYTNDCTGEFAISANINRNVIFGESTFDLIDKTSNQKIIANKIYHFSKLVDQSYLYLTMIIDDNNNLYVLDNYKDTSSITSDLLIDKYSIVNKIESQDDKVTITLKNKEVLSFKYSLYNGNIDNE